MPCSCFIHRRGYFDLSNIGDWNVVPIPRLSHRLSRTRLSSSYLKIIDMEYWLEQIYISCECRIMINFFTSANHLPRLWQLFLLARSWTRMIPCTVWKKTCLVFRWLWLPPTSQSSTKKDFCCCVPSWNSCSFTCSQFKVSFFHVAIFTSIEQPTVQEGFGSAVSWLKKMASES